MTYPKEESTFDFEVEDQGSLVLLYPLTAAAQTWVEENLPEDRLTWGLGVVIEPRYVSDIVDGISADRLTVVGWGYYPDDNPVHRLNILNAKRDAAKTADERAIFQKDIDILRNGRERT